MKRGALILDDLGGASSVLVDILTNNGYIVHVITFEERAEKFVKKPVYVHILSKKMGGGEVAGVEESSQSSILLSINEVVGDIDFDSVEVALLLSPYNNLNMILARLAKEKGVPRVIMVVRDAEMVKEAMSMDVEILDISHSIIYKVQRILSLKFSRFVPINGEIYMVETLITGDSKLLGKTIEDVENGFEVDAVVIKSGKLARSSETVIQAGDILIAVGSKSNLNELLENA